MLKAQHTWTKPQDITLKEVARHVGVSESTASVVLNGARSGTRVSLLTRQSVLEAADKLGYRANGLARSLTTGVTNRFGFYSGTAKLDSRNLFFAELMSGVFAGCHEVGYNTLIHTAGKSSTQLVDLVSSRAVDGLIVHALPEDPILDTLKHLKIPAVAIVDGIEGLPSVVVDDFIGGRVIAQHFFELGHRHVMVKRSPVRFTSETRRMDGFLQRAAELNLEVTVGRETNWIRETQLSAGDIDTLTDQKNPATAIFVWEDSGAERLCSEVEGLGLKVPSQVAVAGYNGLGSTFKPIYNLTTINASWDEVGRVAVHGLLALLKGESFPHETVLPVSFQRGGTT